jgi:PAS domain S-box-containing protein
MGRGLTVTIDTHEGLCQQIVQDAQEAIVVADREGVIRLWNASAEVLFGYPAEEALGQTLDLIVPERQRKAHWAGYREVMKTGVTRYGRDLLKVPALRNDGTRISLEFSIILLRDGSEPVGAAAVIRDVTARFFEEKALKQRLAALEAQVEGAEG